jgi:hypothetical protein
MSDIQPTMESKKPKLMVVARNLLYYIKDRFLIALIPCIIVFVLRICTLTPFDFFTYFDLPTFMLASVFYFFKCYDGLNKSKSEEEIKKNARDVYVTYIFVSIACYICVIFANSLYDKDVANYLSSAVQCKSFSSEHYEIYLITSVSMLIFNILMLIFCEHSNKKLQINGR